MLQDPLKTLDKEQKANWSFTFIISHVCLQCYALHSVTGYQPYKLMFVHAKL